MPTTELPEHVARNVDALLTQVAQMCTPHAPHGESPIVAVLDDAGARHWAGVSDRAALDALLADDGCGRSVELDGVEARLT